MNTINGRTPEEIKCGLECCTPGDFQDCYICPYKPLRDCADVRINDAIAYIQKLEAAAPKWISVEERLPSNTRKVLIYTRRHKTFISYYNPADGMWGYEYDYDITHWMKLPEPPEEVNNEN